MNDLLSANTSMALTQATQANAAGAAKNAKEAREIAKVEQAAREFEAVFISEMMKPMFEGISTEAPFGGGKGEEVFRGLLLNEYGKILAQQNSFGITDQVKAEMIRIQEETNKQAGVINE